MWCGGGGAEDDWCSSALEMKVWFTAAD